MKTAKEARTEWERTLSEAVQRFLKPVARLLLRLGMGAAEFSALAKTVFVQVASEEYGIRGRPTNASRVAAMTGLSRKEVARLRDSDGVGRWTPRQAVSPMNEVLHYWHTDPDFLDSPGRPRTLPMQGQHGFEALVSRYAGDIPAGAMRRELERRSAITATQHGLVVEKRFAHRTGIDEDFVRNLAFSLEALCTTLAHNTDIVQRSATQLLDSSESERRLERAAWTSSMSRDEMDRFRRWVWREGMKFLERADNRIGECELPKSSRHEASGTVGVGVYFFELE